MSSTYSSLLRIELIGTGDQPGTWGTTTNTNLGTLIEQAIAGTATFSVTAGNVTLSALNGSSDQSRCMALLVTGSAGVSRNIIAPASSKIYIVSNTADAAVVLKTSGSTGLTIPSGITQFAYYNGTDFIAVSQPYDADLKALADLATTGLIVRTGSGTAATRSVAVSGTGLSITNADGVSGNPTIASNATNANTASTIVARDGSGNFSAGTITATFSGNLTGNVTGNLTGNVTGNADTATYATSAGSATSATTATTATNLAGGAANRIPYQSGSGTTTFLAAPTSAATAVVYNGSSIGWSAIVQTYGSGCVYENSQTITSNYTMTTGKNGQSAGPIAIDTGVTVTIPDGSNWVIN